MKKILSVIKTSQNLQLALLVIVLVSLTVLSVVFAEMVISERPTVLEKAKLDQIVKDGKLSAEDAKKKLSVVEKGSKLPKVMKRRFPIGHHQQHLHRGYGNLQREKWSGPVNKETVKAKLDQMVKDGKLSAEDAKKKLSVVEKRSKGRFSKVK